MMENSNVITVVLGWNYSTTLGVVRSLGMGGHTVDLYFVTNTPGSSRITASSKYLRKVTEHIGRDDEAIIADLERIYGEEEAQCILIPTDDYTSSLLDRHYGRLSTRFSLPHIGEGEDGAITRLMDKSLQAEKASSFGIRTIGNKTLFLPREGRIEIPEGVNYPCFVKPLVSLDGRKTEMRKCGDPASLAVQLETMRGRWSERTVIIQDFIDIDEEYSISGLCLDETVILPALLKRLYVGKHERGVTIVGQLVPLEENIGFASLLRDFLKSLHYTGPLCIDLVRSKDRVYFSEINFRTAGSLYGFVKAGANLPSVFVKALSGAGWDVSETSVSYGKTFFYDKVGWEDLIFGLCTKKDFENYLKTSDYTFMKDADDPVPGQLLYDKLNREYRRKRIKRLFPFTSKLISRILKKIR